MAMNANPMNANPMNASPGNGAAASSGAAATSTGAPTEEHLTATVLDLGRAAGLDAVGVAPADPFLDTRRHLEQRRAAGLHGGMQFTYRNPARSTDPSRSVPNARALVVGARRYDRQRPAHPANRETLCGPEQHNVSRNADRKPPRPPAAARIARYSWRDHYAPLRQSLQTVADHLTAKGFQAKVLVDDNALVDRQAAYRAGLGWYGKNTNLLLPGRGSWFVLGAVVTDAPLSPAEHPVADGCGTCRRCMPACPTGALIAPGVLDARRCLAWLLEAPGDFPFEYRVALGDRIYGCDDCQEVCPVNTRAGPPPPAEADAEASTDVIDLLDLEDADILQSFGRWYIPDRQPRYVRRNALVVLGNTGDPSDPATECALRHYLKDPDPMLRAHAVWAAARVGRPDLLELVAEDDDPKVRIELGRLPERRVP
jgi:epoxyqueuosine reductase